MDKFGRKLGEISDFRHGSTYIDFLRQIKLFTTFKTCVRVINEV